VRKLLVALVMGVLSVSWMSAVAYADPPGNNGTVKIQEHGDIDSIPDNDPHVGCQFQIEFRGFDEGDLTATWALAAQPPSGTFTFVKGGEAGIGEDAAGGAPDLDAVVVVTLTESDLAGLIEHPQQGFDLKLEVHAEGSIGNDAKFKVFWVEGCPPGSSLGAPADTSMTFGSAADIRPDVPNAGRAPWTPILAAVLMTLGALVLLQPVRGSLRRRGGN
jgi:hypothetical protein